MNQLKNINKIIKPYLTTSLRVLVILFIVMIIFTIIIFFMNPDNIEIKNSNRRKIEEKIKDTDQNHKNNYFKKKTNNLRNIRNNTTKKIVENGIFKKKNKNIPTEENENENEN